jgi:small subunit ribosomal protein S17
MAEETPETETTEAENAPAPEAEAAVEEAPAEEAAAADDTPPEPAAPALSAKEERAARAQAERSSRPSRTPEERNAERRELRRKKAEARRRRRQQEKAKRTGPKAEGTPPAPPKESSPQMRMGTVVSDKADKTITVRIDVARRHRRYPKIVRSSSTLHAHDEANDAHEGDRVRVIESRPLSRTKRWKLEEVLERAK